MWWNLITVDVYLKKADVDFVKCCLKSTISRGAGIHGK